jgi:hypothetical protein
MSDESDDICGHPTEGGDGPPCQNPPGENGRCHIPTHNDPDAENPHGRERNRPSKQQQENIASVIEGGGSIREACRRAGIHVSTFYSWMEYGEEEPESAWGDFRERLVRARGEGEGKYRQTLMALAEETGDTATLMAMLKQRYPESWGDVDRGEQSGNIVVDLGEPDEYEIDPDTLEVQE